jgi:predicted kinase
VKNLTTYESFLEEGVNDPGILKAFFMAGGPGSGKSFVASEIFGFPKEAVGSVSYRTGLKLVNNDNAFEAGLKKYGLSAGELANYAKDEEKWAEVMRIRDKSKGLTKKLQDNYIAGRLGQVIDGTGKNFNKIRGHREMYQDFGYDTYMVFVNTSLEIALERNRMRERRLPDEIVEKMWKEVQDNLGKFSRLFGKQNMIIVDNSSYEDSEKILAHIEKEITRRVDMPIKNYLGIRWIEDQRNPGKNQPAGVKKKAGHRR